MKNSISLLRRVGFLEGVSFLLLVGIAMPLKYAAGMPMAVKIFGWIHGALFVVLCAVLWRAMRDARWPISRAALIFIAALLPFGPFVADRHLAKWEEEYLRGGQPQ